MKKSGHERGTCGSFFMSSMSLTIPQGRTCIFLSSLLLWFLNLPTFCQPCSWKARAMICHVLSQTLFQCDFSRSILFEIFGFYWHYILRGSRLVFIILMAICCLILLCPSQFALRALLLILSSSRTSLVLNIGT